MDINLTDLTKIDMMPSARAKDRSWRGAWYVDTNGQCIAKTCPKCRSVLSVAEFNRNKTARYGLNSVCTSCRRRGTTVPTEDNSLASLASFDVSDLIEVKMKRPGRDGFYGSYFLSEISGECRGRSCSSCHLVLPAVGFKKHPKNLYGLDDKCVECSRTAAASRKQNPVTGGRAYSSRMSSRTEEQIRRDRALALPDGQKRCRKCKVAKDFGWFHRDACDLSGLQSECKPCAIASVTDRARRTFQTHWQESGISESCYVCQEDWDHSDHVIPSNLGGPDGAENRLPMCEHHNTSKQDTPLLQWLRDRHPGKVEEVMTRVLSYGVRPYTRLDVWTEVPADHVPRIKIRIK